MPQFQTIKAVFNGGEMSPLMDGRTDSEKYATGCRILENFIVRSYGGAFKRPGTRFGAANSDVTDCVRLIPFRRSTDINFVLGFKTNAIKVWSYSAGAFTLVTTLTTTYTEAEIADLHYCQLNDIMHLTVGTKHPRIITRANDGTWSIIDTPFQFAPALDPPSDAVTMTLVYDANSWAASTSYSVGNFVLYLNELYRCKTANSDASFTAAKWDKAAYKTPWNVGQSYTAGDVVEYFGSNYFCITTHSPSTSANRPGTGAQWVLISITDYRLIASSATFDSNEVGSIWLLSPGSTGRVSSETIPAAPSTTTAAAVFIQGSYLVRTNWAANASPAGTILQLQESLDRMNFTTIKEWQIAGTLEGTVSYTADAPNTGGWYRMVAIRTGANTTNTSTMTIEPAVGKLDIPFEIESYTSTTEVKGVPKLAVDSLIPNEVIGTAFPVWRKGAFSTTRGFPKTVTFHDSRLWYACTSTEPMRIWGSQTDDFYTFLTGSLDTSGIDVTLAATQANDIQWITSFKRTMVIGTTGEEWTMDSGDTDSALTPSNVRLRRWSRYGSSKHQPVLSGDGLLWLTRDNRLREFAYVFERDGYSAPEMTLLAEHVTCRSPVIQMLYSQAPDPIIWLVHEDGTWSGFTYDRENNVTAWHRHRSQMECKSMCTLYSADTAADSMIFLMDYNVLSLESIDGSQMRTAMTSANLSDNVYCLDSWISHNSITSSGGITTFLGVTTANPQFAVDPGNLNMIFGGTSSKTDGSPYISDVVSASSGSVIFNGLSVDASSPQVLGLHFTAYLVPNRMEIQLQDGTAQMRKWRISRASFRIFRAYFAYVWRKITEADFTHYSRIIRDTDEFPIPPDDPTQSYSHRTGQTLPQSLNFDWGQACDIVIASRHAVPFNILGMILEIEVEGTSGAGT